MNINKTLLGWVISRIKPLSKITSFLLVLNLVLMLGVNVAQAASVTSLTDNLSRLKASTLSDHEIKFVSPTGVAAAGTITLTFGTPGLLWELLLLSTRILPPAVLATALPLLILNKLWRPALPEPLGALPLLPPLPLL